MKRTKVVGENINILNNVIEYNPVGAIPVVKFFWLQKKPQFNYTIATNFSSCRENAIELFMSLKTGMYADNNRFYLGVGVLTRCNNYEKEDILKSIETLNFLENLIGWGNSRVYEISGYRNSFAISFPKEWGFSTVTLSLFLFIIRLSSRSWFVPVRDDILDLKKSLVNQKEENDMDYSDYIIFKKTSKFWTHILSNTNTILTPSVEENYNKYHGISNLITNNLVDDLIKHECYLFKTEVIDKLIQDEDWKETWNY